jgi:hypothetical protein
MMQHPLSLPIFILAVGVIFAAITLAFSFRYTGGAAGKNLTWTLDRFSGKTVFCTPESCYEPKPKP